MRDLPACMHVEATRITVRRASAPAPGGLRIGIVLGYPYRACHVTNMHQQYMEELRSRRPMLMKKIMKETRDGDGSFKEIYDAWEGHADELELDMAKLSELRELTKNSSYVQIHGIRWGDSGGEDEESRELQRRIRECIQSAVYIPPLSKLLNHLK